jgi:AbiV family abortive infection protein
VTRSRPGFARHHFLTKRSITPALFAEGALRAIEQAFRLADDAFVLLQKDRWPTSVVLALFAREELGRYSLLADATREALDGKSITASTIAKRCEDHLEKLRRGFVGTTVRLNEADSSALDAFFANPEAPENAGFRERLDRMHAAMGRRQHQDAHKRRLRALYVELSPSGGWDTPSAVTKEEAEQEVWTAAADCANTVARFWGNSDIHPLLASLGIKPTFTRPLALSSGTRGV